MYLESRPIQIRKGCHCVFRHHEGDEGKTFLFPGQTVDGKAEEVDSKSRSKK